VFHIPFPFFDFLGITGTGADLFLEEAPFLEAPGSSSTAWSFLSKAVTASLTFAINSAVTGASTLSSSIIMSSAALVDVVSSKWRKTSSFLSASLPHQANA